MEAVVTDARLRCLGARQSRERAYEKGGACL
jgi:hypothetical protein